MKKGLSIGITVMAQVLMGLGLGACNSEVRSKRTPSQAIGRFLASPQSLKDSQQAIAYDICLALRSKNTLFRAEKNGHKFVFDLEHSSCTGGRFNSSIEAILQVPSSTTAPMQWVAESNKFFTFEETHENGLMAVICSGVLKGQATSNTYENKDGTRSQAVFSNAEKGVQAVSVATAKADSQGQFVVFKQDEMKIVTGQIPSNAYIGIVLSRTQSIPCANERVEALTQKYLHD